MKPQISRSTLTRLHEIVAADPAREVCGLLLGSGGVIEAIAEAKNVADDPRVSFEIDPRTHFAAIKASRAGGPAIIGSYHSHPNGDARPSMRDLAMAQPGELWLIFRGTDGRAWLRAEDRFQALSLVIR